MFNNGSLAQLNNRSSSPGELANLLTQLSNSDPYRPAKFSGQEQRTTERIANWVLGAACGLTLSIIPLAGYHHFLDPQAKWVKTAALLIAILVQLSGLLSVAIRSIGLLLLATRWKSVTLTTLLREVEVDEGHARGLGAFSKGAMDRAEQHLRLKLSRLERRAGAFLGDKTAVLSLIALTMPIVKEAGGFSWIRRGLDTSSGFTSWESMTVYFFAFLLGISLGAIGLKMLAERIRYQLEVLSLGQSMRDSNTASVCYPSGNPR